MAVQQFGLTWWGGQWVAALERLGATWENRLPRGRTYARKGTVHDLRIDAGEVSAMVDGSRPRPYLAEIFLPTWSDATWVGIIEELAAQLRHAAALMDGRMPEDVDETLGRCGVSLFPQPGELDTECSCPDWANPCKHIAAVHYVLAAKFDEDPFLLFELRGRSKDRILELLRAKRAGADSAADVDEPTCIMIEDVRASDLFGDAANPPKIAIHPDESHDPLATLRRLGPLPAATGGHDRIRRTTSDLELAVTAASEAAWKILRGT